MIQKLKIAAVLIFCTCCVYFGLIRHEDIDSDHCSLWQYARTQVQDDYNWLVQSDPFWTVFDPSQAPISQDSLVRTMPNGASIHQAVWKDEDGHKSVENYYCDKKNQGLIVSYVEYFDTPRITPYDEWHYINDNGIIRFDWQKLLANLLFVFALFYMPAIVLVELISHSLSPTATAENR